MNCTLCLEWKKYYNLDIFSYLSLKFELEIGFFVVNFVFLKIILTSKLSSLLGVFVIKMFGDELAN